MKQPMQIKRIALAAALLLLALLVVSCGGETAPPATEAPEATAPPETEPPADLEGDPVRGGLLYDKWWVIPAAEEAEGEHADEHAHEEGEEHVAGQAPEGDHPLWATQDTNTRSGADTWRCKECHGWDYQGADGAYGSGSHFTGFPGVFDAKDKDPAEVLAALQGSTNADHDFSSLMEEQDLIDLALFITQEVIDDDELVGEDGASTGEAAAGENNYSQVCANCHGPSGNAINFHGFEEPEFVAHIAADNPWEFIHKVRFGQPGWPMPSAISNGWSLEDVANVLAYAQTLPAEAALSGGGQLYDKWWVPLGLDAPEEDNPLWATQDTNTRSGADTWRCKECHGWDYQGADGAYGSGSHFTGFPGVLQAAAMSTEELVSALSGGVNPDHDFSGAMDEAGLTALATFIQQEAADVSPFIDENAASTGDPASGEGLFSATCAACHGVDGKAINFHDPDDPEYIGTIAVDNPWEFIHKVSFGQPGAPMPAGQALGWSLEDIADLLAYAQTLPTE